MIRQIWKFFCSVKLTVVLFVLILIPSIIGTVILQNAPDPSQYVEIYGPTWDRIFRLLGFYDVYHDWRFSILLVLLGLNTLACTLSRFKLRWSRAGALMTHTGLLLILLGALAGAVFGVKGFMLIREGEATGEMSLGEATQKTQKLPFEVKLVDFILETHEQPANKLIVRNEKTGRQQGFTIEEGKTIALPQSRWSNLPKMFGLKPASPTTVTVEETLPHASVVTSISDGPEQTGMAAMEFKLTGGGTQRQAYLISQIERPFIFGMADLAIAYLALENENEIDGRIEEIIARMKAGDQLEVVSGESVRKTYPAEVGSRFAVEGTNYFIETLRYVPDFLITPSREVVSRSDQPNNPALHIRVTGPDGFSQEQWIFAHFPSMHSTGALPFEVRFKRNPHALEVSEFLLAVKPRDAAPVLAVIRDGKLAKKKEVQPGEAIPVSDTPFLFTIENFHENANITRTIENRPDMPNQSAVKISVQGSPEPFYLWEGIPTDVPGYKMVFQKQERIKDFLSILQVVNGGHVMTEKKIEVNDPLKYGGYTFYQSTYDSEHGRWSGLQVKKDPGVGLVYAGFIIMTAGMVVIFYVNPLVRKSKRSAERNAQSNVAIGAAKYE